ncbi:hypothetical protein NQ318_021951 [Aromia moschata]|uniref:Transposase n=1 Tax=Aromia moschata TaxID=1265417 RepID=A0AAV8XWA5_9CUCU|nr:hypothetical protein NQ318_021951 [Aromia moschata]
MKHDYAFQFSVAHAHYEKLATDIQDNPHKPTRQVAADNDVSKTSILRFLKNEKYRPYKIHLVQELNDDDPDRRLEFCEIMANRCQYNPLFIKNIIFSDEEYDEYSS